MWDRAARAPRSDLPILMRTIGLPPFRRQPGDLGELAGVLESLHETRDYLDPVVVQQVAGEVAEVQVRLVAGGDDVAQSDPFLHRPGQEGAEGGCPALADEAHRAGQSVGAAGGGAGPDVVPHVGQPQAVGAAAPQP